MLRTFNDMESRGPFYKLTNEREVHDGLCYKDGLNVDIVPFNPHGECQAGGMYFFERHQLVHVSRYVKDAYWIREVTLCSDSQIYEEENKLKAD